MRGDNLVLERILPKHAYGLNQSLSRKFMLSVTKETYYALVQETKELGMMTVQDTCRKILAEWFKSTRKMRNPE